MGDRPFYICICYDTHFPICIHISITLDRQQMLVVTLSKLASNFHLLVCANPIEKAKEGQTLETSSVPNNMLPSTLHVLHVANMNLLLAVSLQLIFPFWQRDPSVLHLGWYRRLSDRTLL